MTHGMERGAHRESVYATRRSDEVGGFQARPDVSLALVRRAAPDPEADITAFEPPRVWNVRHDRAVLHRRRGS